LRQPEHVVQERVLGPRQRRELPSSSSQQGRVLRRLRRSAAAAVAVEQRVLRAPEPVAAAAAPERAPRSRGRVHGAPQHRLGASSVVGHHTPGRRRRPRGVRTAAGRSEGREPEREVRSAKDRRQG
jgi:hypothetical protein